MHPQQRFYLMQAESFSSAPTRKTPPEGWKEADMKNEIHDYHSRWWKHSGFLNFPRSCLRHIYTSIVRFLTVFEPTFLCCFPQHQCHFETTDTIVASHRVQAVNFSASFRIFTCQGCRGNKFTGAYQFTDLGSQRLLCHWRFSNQHFYTVYIQEDFIWIVLGSLDDYFCCGLNLFSTYMYMKKKQYSTFVTRMRAIANS